MALDVFFLKEAEHKMRNAALLEDYQTALEIKVEVVRLRAELAAKPVDVARPKVIKLKDRQEFVAPADNETDGDSKEPEEDEVNPDVINILNDALEKAKGGHIAALALLVGVTNNGHIIDVYHAVTGNVVENARIFVGGAYTFANDILGYEQDLYDEVDEDDE